MINIIAPSDSMITPIHPAATSAGDSEFGSDLLSGTGAIFGKYECQCKWGMRWRVTMKL